MFEIKISFGNAAPPVKRDNKGKSLIEARDDYVVVDLETTGLILIAMK